MRGYFSEDKRRGEKHLKEEKSIDGGLEILGWEPAPVIYRGSPK